jgi:Dyp-type peroxidase family
MTDTLDLADIQGLVARGYSTLRAACYLMLEIVTPDAARTWLGQLSTRVATGEAVPAETALNVALTSSGLQKLGLSAEILAAFSTEFLEGMITPFRSRILGDDGGSAPQYWAWGGPQSPEVELLLLLFARDDASLSRLYAAEAEQLSAHGLRQTARLDTVDLGDKEHFGFHDGVSQPIIPGLSKTGTPDNTVKVGEFVLGYPNEYGLYTDRPLVSPQDDPQGRLPGDAAGSGNRDLGRNGSYLVFRQLSQDVAGFWAFMQQSAAVLGGSDSAAPTRLAARMVGRWPSGAPLVLAPDQDASDLADANDFGYFHTDALGLRCPLGAHVRRANPRDSLDPQPGSQQSVAVGKRHRLLRRGREYGPAPASSGDPPGQTVDRGLHFICLNANIARQFEFIQHTWVNNPKFHGLYDDADPLVASHRGPGARFTIQADPVRKQITGLPQFVTVRGGAYFFLPGVRALRYLAGV